jgi:hypothetical protein
MYQNWFCEYFLFRMFTLNLKKFSVQKPLILSLHYLIRVLFSQLQVFQTL